MSLSQEQSVHLGTAILPTHFPHHTQRKRTILKCILVVEDDSSTASLLMNVLKEETAYYAFHAVTGAQAVQFCRSIKPALLLVDYRLPDMSGIELADQLHAVHDLAAVPVLILSAATMPQDEIAERHLASLSKPFELDELLALIESLLTWGS